MKHQVDLWTVEFCIKLLGNINLGAEIFPQGVHFVQQLGWRPSFSIYILVYLSHLHKFRSQGIRLGLDLFAGSLE
jgi:hypothetical protein